MRNCMNYFLTLSLLISVAGCSGADGKWGPVAFNNNAVYGFTESADTDTYTVTTTLDFTNGSLRQAIESCNTNNGDCKINFDIPISDPGYNGESGTWKVTFDDTPPSLLENNILIDGTSQSHNQGDLNTQGHEIIIDGNNHTIEYAFSIINASQITIRGFTISHFLYGIQIYGEGSHHIHINDNYVGTDHRALAGRGNYVGMELLSGAHQILIGGTAEEERNTVSGNYHVGIRIADSTDNLVKNNYVGTDRTGTAAIPNYDGISVEGKSTGNLIGGTVAAERNLASGNVAYGIVIYGAGAKNNRVIGNFIGTDKSGNAAVPNTYGILFDDRAADNIVGGLEEGEWNLISGNTAFGAYIYNNGTNNNTIIGNRIGTNANGTGAVPNETGVWIDGAAYENTVDKNLISGNLVSGVTIFALNTDRNTIIGNLIGTDIIGTGPLGNGRDGVRIIHGPRANIIGGSVENANIIGYNGKNGVAIESDNSRLNKISCNQFLSNGNLGIDLYPEGINVNDPGDLDEGPNSLMNCPVITSISCSGSACIIGGTIDSPNRTGITIEVYLAGLTGRSSREGKRYLGQVQPDSSGAWTMQAEVPEPCPVFTATATDETGNTSEFSQNP